MGWAAARDLDRGGRREGLLPAWAAGGAAAYPEPWRGGRLLRPRDLAGRWCAGHGDRGLEVAAAREEARVRARERGEGWGLRKREGLVGFTVVGWMDGRMDRWMDVWMDGCSPCQRSMPQLTPPIRIKPT